MNSTQALMTMALQQHRRAHERTEPTAPQWCRICRMEEPTATTEEYVVAVVRALLAGNELTVQRVCPECGRRPRLDGSRDHVLVCINGLEVVVVGCEGYWCVDPAEVGLSRGQWTPVEPVVDGPECSVRPGGLG